MKSDFFTNSFLTNLNKNYISNKKEDNHSKISIVMPSYNQVKFIENSILSILNQEYHSIELIIVDGGSTDGTTDIIKKYEKHIAYWVSEKDEGQSDALNKGFEKCTGEIYGWLNADDVYLPYTFQKIARAFHDNHNKLIVYGDWLEIDQENNIISKNYSFNFSLKQFIYEGYCLHPQALFWKKDVHLRFGKSDKDLKTNMDAHMIIMFARNEGEKKFHLIPNFLSAWRRHKGQISGNLPHRALADRKIFYKRYIIKRPNIIFCSIIWFVFRFRRMWWYFKRAGFFYVFNKLKNIFSRNFKI
jgi:glycosyltransferase involved in cell wall biosynthesis